MKIVDWLLVVRRFPEPGMGQTELNCFRMGNNKATARGCSTGSSVYCTATTLQCEDVTPW